MKNQMNFKEYKTAARYAAEVNAGYTANLFGISECPYKDGHDWINREAAWIYGHQQAQRHVSGEMLSKTLP